MLNGEDIVGGDMLFKISLKIAAVVMLVALTLPVASPTHAATAAIGMFYAGCGNFSVDVTVSGTNDDGNGVDKFRYLITDGNNKKLYQEDATRPINVTAGSMVFNLSYDADGVADGFPGKNPIQFAVIELDSNGNAGSQIQGASYDAPCLPASGKANRSGTFVPPKIVVGTVVAGTPLYQGPGVGPLSLSTQPGAQHLVVYRTPDATWVAIFVGGNDLVWIPASAINADLSRLALPPTRIDGSNPNQAAGGNAPTPAPVSGTTALVLDNLRLRSAPSTAASILAVIPAGTTVPVLGRSSDGTFIQVSYNGQVGWVWAGLVRLSQGSVTSPTGVTARILSDLRLRSAPSLSASILTVIPYGTTVPALGRSADNTFVKVSYNGQVGWVWSGLVRLSQGRVSDLPVAS
jgi:uncharacterized protein YraI